MAPAKPQGGEQVKRRRKKKARTNVSSSSESSSSSGSESEEVEKTKKAKKQKKTKKLQAEIVEEPEEIHDAETANESEGPPLPESEPKMSFSSWYLKQVAKELEDDLDKVRSAGDFSDTSLPVLINALQQGEATFTEDEKRRIIAAT